MARRSRRQREASALFWGWLFKLVLVGGLVAAIAYYAYEVGQKLAAQDGTALRSEIERLSVEVSEKTQKVDELNASLAQTGQELQDLKNRYQTVAPANVQEILNQVQAKLKQGVPADRIAFFVGQAQIAGNCITPETRRFLVKTSNYTGAATWVRFNERITISGQGTAANGGREQWFDVTAPVTLTFTPQGGKEQVVSGVLPLKHALISKDKEYHFTATVGSRGFIEVSAEWCDVRD